MENMASVIFAGGGVLPIAAFQEPDDAGRFRGWIAHRWKWPNRVSFAFFGRNIVAGL
jgi:hypothetical protein